MEDKRIQQVEEFVTHMFEKSTQQKYLEHTKRVSNYLDFLCNEEGVDSYLPRVSALLHDVGMTVDPSFAGHVEKSKMIATAVLPTFGYSQLELDTVVKIVGSHHPVPGAALDSIEEQILFDADNFDLIGPVGALRWIGSFGLQTSLLSSAELFLSINEKCEAARGSLFYTKSARKHAHSALKSTIDFFGHIARSAKSNIDGALTLPVPFFDVGR
jgi:putative nucleotidyltransferase with HDIG domain